MAYRYPTAFSSWGEEEREAMHRVHLSGRYTMGPEVEAFEHEFAAYHARKHGIMVNSGSSANLVAVAALHEKEKEPLEKHRLAERVIVPAIAWSTTYAPLVQHGKSLYLVDVDHTWNAPVPRQVAHIYLRAAIVCSILGNPAYLFEWSKLAADDGIYLIEDNCESLGAERDGHKCGTTGVMSTFSFFHSHQISAIEGGMILTDDDELARICRILRAHGWTRDVGPPPTMFSEEYNFVLMGYNVRPLELHAAVAREQLKKLPGFISARLENWRHFAKITVDLPITIPRINGTLSPFGLSFALNEEGKREELARALRIMSIDCRLPTGGSFRLHPYGSWLHKETPNADRIHRAGMFLGNAPWDIRDDIERAVKVIRDVLR